MVLKVFFFRDIALGKEISEEKIYDRSDINRVSAFLILPINVSEELGYRLECLQLIN